MVQMPDSDNFQVHLGMLCLDPATLNLHLTELISECVNTVSLCLCLQYCQSCQSMDFPSLLCLHMPSAASAHAQ